METRWSGESGFTKGQNVKVVEGPFSGFFGVVGEVTSDRRKLVVLVSMFGRSAPAELDFLQVVKL